jgi:2-oxo-3-hexenedioate decarboxylase
MDRSLAIQSTSLTRVGPDVVAGRQIRRQCREPQGMMRGMMLTPPDHEAIAAEALAAMDSARQIAPFSERYPGLGIEDAYRIAARLCALRTARGERVIGRKIGFTNRTIWADYGVHAPNWGFVFDTTVRDLPPPRQAAQHPFTLAPFAEPRIEPEIVFRLAAAPSPEMDEEALFGCIDWVAQGFEIVHSVFPGWKFAPADTVIANGLHGALLLAPRHPAGLGSAADWISNLAGFEIDLLRDGTVVDRGHSANVLDGPLSALRHLVGLLARDPTSPLLAIGDIVTTGTLTRALPILPGESWSTTLHGIELGGRPVWFS